MLGSSSQDDIGTVLDADTLPTHRTVQKSDEEQAAQELIGHIYAGSYQVERHIASGTMGRVFAGTQLRLERPVAIKILRQQGTAIDERFAKRFLREASIASQLAHPNIVQIYDYGETRDRQLFMVMEHLEGVTLSELIRAEAPFSIERTLSIAIQIGRALRRAHAAGVVHRDLKPANVIVKTDEEEGFDFVKVLDFGLVKLFAPHESPVHAPFDDDHLTRPGNMVGTPDYVSPEQALGDEVDGRTDIYSFGVMMFQMIAGRLPFIGATILEMVNHHLSSPVPRISDVNPNVVCPVELEEIIRRAMSKTRDERYLTMDELLDDLKAIWREWTDESYGTDSFQAIDAAAEPALLVTGGMEPMDPSEQSPELTRARTKPRRVARTFAFVAAALLTLGAAVSVAFCSKTHALIVPSVKVKAAPSSSAAAPERPVDGYKGNPF